jgi:hypothetical protein
MSQIFPQRRAIDQRLRIVRLLTQVLSSKILCAQGVVWLRFRRPNLLWACEAVSFAANEVNQYDRRSAASTEHEESYTC